MATLRCQRLLQKPVIHLSIFSQTRREYKAAPMDALSSGLRFPVELRATLTYTELVAPRRPLTTELHNVKWTELMDLDRSSTGPAALSR